MSKWGIPERDIWFLGVMDQGSCQIGRLLGTPPPPPSPGSSGWHSVQGIIFFVFRLDFDSYESSLNFETGVLHRISSWIYLAEWFGLGSIFWKKYKLLHYFPNYNVHCFGRADIHGFNIQVDIQSKKLFLEFLNWTLTHVKDIWISRPGFYTEFRAESM